MATPQHRIHPVFEQALCLAGRSIAVILPGVMDSIDAGQLVGIVMDIGVVRRPGAGAPLVSVVRLVEPRLVLSGGEGWSESR